MKNIIITRIEFNELRSDNCTRLFMNLVDPRIRSVYYGCRVTFQHRRVGNRSVYGEWASKKSRVMFELHICKGSRYHWTDRNEVPAKHRKAWSFMEHSAPIIFEKNKYELSLWRGE